MLQLSSPGSTMLLLPYSESDIMYIYLLPSPGNTMLMLSFPESGIIVAWSGHDGVCVSAYLIIILYLARDSSS